MLMDGGVCEYFGRLSSLLGVLATSRCCLYHPLHLCILLMDAPPLEPPRRKNQHLPCRMCHIIGFNTRDLYISIHVKRQSTLSALQSKFTTLWATATRPLLSCVGSTMM